MLLKGEKCACNLLEDLKITQPTLSHHMRILCESGLVDSCKEGKWMHYSINIGEFKNLRQILNSYMLTEAEEKNYKKCDCNRDK